MSAYESILENVKVDENTFIELKKQWAEETIIILEQYREQIHMIRKINNKLRGKEYFPPVTNYRDALFHYKLAYESDNIVTLIEQNNSIMEHLHRAVKDGITEIIRTITNEISDFYENQKDDITHIEENSYLQHIIHQLKEKELEIRLYSLEIKRPFDSIEYFENFVKQIGEIKTLLSSDEWYKDINQKLTF